MILFTIIFPLFAGIFYLLKRSKLNPMERIGAFAILVFIGLFLGLIADTLLTILHI